MEICTYFTDHFANQTVTQFFAKSLKTQLLHINKFKKSEKTFCSYGILRGTAEAIKSSKNFIYLDHGFFESSSRSFTENKNTVVKVLDGYFRIISNDLYFNSNYFNTDKTRFNNLNINLKELNKNAEYIILSEPTENTLNFLGIINWTNDTINEIKKHTDREIIVHNKFSKTPLSELLKNAHAFVSLQSTAGYKAIIEGIPAYFTHESLKKYGNIANIEKPLLNHDVLYLASNSQWRLKEFFDDDFKNYVRDISS